ncbi:hypothetical protein RB594_005972 [Gaeumannomyces avenae]
MGLFDDAASTLGVGGGGHGSSSRKHRSHKGSSGSHKSSSHRHRSRSRDRGGDRDRGISSIFGGGGGGGGGSYEKNNASHSSLFGGSGSGKEEKRRGSGDAKSFFNLPLGNSSRGSFFGFGTDKGRSPSYYKRSPRQSFMQRSYRKLKRLLRDLVHYAKRHPLRVFMLVVMPLVTGGALTALLARFGMRMPAALESLLGMGAKVMKGDSVGLVGDAVRMASGAGAAATAATTIARGWDGDKSWEKRTTYRRNDDDDWYGEGYGSSSGGGGGGGGGGLGSMLGGFGGFGGGGSSSGGGNNGWMGSVSKFFS